MATYINDPMPQGQKVTSLIKQIRYLSLYTIATAVLYSLIPDVCYADSLLSHQDETLCYERTYSADHLSSHPDQITKAMRVKFDTIRGEKDFGFMIEVKVRGSDKRYTTGGLCHPGQNGIVASCFVECDAGNLTISKKTDQSILLHISREIAFSCEGTELFLRGKDDIDFRLDQAPLSECSSMKIPLDQFLK